MTQLLDQAFDAFKDIVGEKNFDIDRRVLKTYETATFATQNHVLAIIRPGKTQEIQQCMEVANAFKVAIYPISTGLNIGYGSRVPSADNCVIMELKRMNRIIELNEELAYVTLEPGVTQLQLHEYIKKNKSKLWMDVTGSFASHSMIGNIAERGFGHTPYSDHFDNVCGLEVVLPNGKCINTGFGKFKHAEAKSVFRWGLGPYVDGLFTQSNLGIITRLTLWLMPEPEYFLNFFFSVDHNEQLEEVVNLLRPLRLDGTINSALHLGNDYKVLSSIQLYPWNKTDGQTPLSKEIINEFSEQWDFGAWNGAGALYGTKETVTSAKKRIRKKLKGKVKKLRFLGDRKLSIAEFLQKPYQKITGINLPEMLKLLKPVYGMTKGIPTDEMIPSTYWRKKTAAPAITDPDRDQCGLLWCAPVLPTDGKCSLEVWQITESTLLKYGFEPSVSFTLITPRAMDCIIAISYDREVENEDVKAKDCHDELLKNLTLKGYYPYRLGIQSMYIMADQDKVYREFFQKIKLALDPERVMAPGRYEK